MVMGAFCRGWEVGCRGRSVRAWLKVKAWLLPPGRLVQPVWRKRRVASLVALALDLWPRPVCLDFAIPLLERLSLGSSRSLWATPRL